MIGRFWIDGKSSREFGLYINAPSVYGSPESDVEFKSIPGRNGDIIISNNRYENIKIVYPITMYAKNAEKMAEKTAKLKAWLNSSRNYRKLSDTYNPGYYRMAAFSSEISAEIAGTMLSAEIEFNCKPFLYRNDGDYWITAKSDGATKIINPEPFESRPMLDITTQGNAVIYINNRTLTITSDTATHMIVDCEIMDAYDDAINQNSKISSADFTLSAGENTISIQSDSAVDMKIRPRWRRL